MGPLTYHDWLRTTLYVGRLTEYHAGRINYAERAERWRVPGRSKGER